MAEYATCVDVEAFGASRALFETVVEQLADPDGVFPAAHAEWEELLTTRARELMRQLFQDHLDLRAQREQRLGEVVDAGQVARSAVETGHTRALTTVFGEVTVTRRAYRRRGCVNLGGGSATSIGTPAGQEPNRPRWLPGFR